MIYLIGGAPRTGKSLLCQQLAAKLKAGWISTDILITLLQLKNDAGVKQEWNADPAAIAAHAEWFLPYLERFIWGVTSMADQYVIEGVDVLPAQVAQLAPRYQLRSVFLGCSHMTLDRFERFPGCSPGYRGLPEALRRQIVQDVPVWSEFIRQQAARFSYAYIDTSSGFSNRLQEAEAVLTGGR